MMGVFLLFGLGVDIIDYVRRQLSQYTYTFPVAGLVSDSKLTGLS